MDHEQVGTALRRLVDHRLARVHRDGDMLHLTAVLDLQAVQRLRLVSHLARPQVVIEIPYQVIESHGSSSGCVSSLTGHWLVGALTPCGYVGKCMHVIRQSITASSENGRCSMGNRC